MFVSRKKYNQLQKEYSQLVTNNADQRFYNAKLDNHNKRLIDFIEDNEKELLERIPWVFNPENKTPFERTKNNPNAYWCVAKKYPDDEFYFPSSFSKTKSGAIKGYMSIWDETRVPKWRSFSKKQGVYLKRVVVVGVD